jgi:hypothetical protein
VAGSHGVRIHRVSIQAPRDSPNTDGVHIQGSSDVRFTDSAVATGDDCVSVGPGTSDVLVSGVTCGPGHGISVGSLGRYPGEEDVRRLRVANCTIAGTSNGVRIKTWRGGSRPTSVSGLVFEDIVMRKVRNPIIIDQEYCPYASCRRESVRAKLTESLAGPSMQAASCWSYHETLTVSIAGVPVRAGAAPVGGEDKRRQVQEHPRRVGDAGGGEAVVQRGEPVPGAGAQGHRPAVRQARGRHPVAVRARRRRRGRRHARPSLLHMKAAAC